ncbi:MAG: hypothetical protein OK456_06685 [Thaumarchaeota archaeon]|nr:hypothetical protein [Nitrososphaerota archaeon]
MLVDEGKVIFEYELSPRLGDRSLPRKVELADNELERLCTYYSMGSNQRRLRVMTELAKGVELRFSDIMQIATNPKLAQDCLQPMLKEGLVVHGKRGSGYQISEKALPLVVFLTVGLGKMLSVLERDIAARNARGPK